jgi:hypothetical protein
MTVATTGAARAGKDLISPAVMTGVATAGGARAVSSAVIPAQAGIQCFLHALTDARRTGS